jgi:hypothetical protein
MRVEYPPDAAGEIIDTDNGGVVQQQPSKDGRRHVWVWETYPEDHWGFRNLWPMLEALRSRYRKEAGLSSYVYLKEDITRRFRTRTTVTGTGSGSSLTFSMTGIPDGVEDGWVECAGQVRAITASSGGTATIGAFWNGSVSGTATVSYWTYDWVRVRVLDVIRLPNDDGRSIRYKESRLVFVIDDPNYDNLG